MSDKPGVIEALSAVMADVQAVRKGDRNAQQGFNFRGIDAVMNAVGPALRKHGVVIVPEVVDARHRDAQTTGGKAAREATVVVTYRAYGPGGDSITIQAPGESLDSGDKATPKAMSVAYRTALLQALTIPTDEPEPDAQTYERERARSAPPAEPQSDDQRKRMHALLGELGLSDREKYIKLANWFVQLADPGRVISSTSEMTGDEAAAFIGYLADRRRKAATPPQAQPAPDDGAMFPEEPR